MSDACIPSHHKRWLPQRKLQPEELTMVRLTVDKVLEAKLRGEAEPLELCDAGGRVIGHFIPIAESSRYSGIKSPTPAAELDRRRREETGRPLAEILRELQGHS
jgi:hypothetical protein